MKTEDYDVMVKNTAVYRDATAEFLAACEDEGLDGQIKIWKLLNVQYATMGLAGEAGEVANKIKKIIRDRGGEIDDEVRELVLGEMGGVMWYLNALAREFDFTLDEVMEYNYHQITDRQERGVLSGDGDNR